MEPGARLTSLNHWIRTRQLAALSYQDFRSIWMANLTAGAAAWALIVARGWLVFELSESSLWVGIVTFAAMAPRMFVTPLTGYISDRFDRRSVLALTFGVNAVHNLLLAVLVLTSVAEVWHLVALSFVNGSARAAQMTASHAFIPNLVPKSLLLNAIALNQVAIHGSRLLGPAAIAPLLATTSVEGAFFLCTGLYIIGMVQVLKIKVLSTGEMNQAQGFVGNMAAGLLYVYHTPTLRAIVLLAMFHCGLTMSFESLLPVLSSQQLAAEGAGFSFLMMAVGGGALASTISLATIRNEATKGRLFLGLGVISGLGPVILAISTNVPIALLGAATMGAAQAGFMALTHTMIQSITPDGIRGRVAGIYSLHVGGMMASANLANGALTEIANAPLILMIGGITFILVMVLSWQIVTLRSVYIYGLRA